ncbi:MAG: Spy/CpxP family protein refolding chaperone [Pyrinomonadaceae bacterium]
MSFSNKFSTAGLTLGLAMAFGTLAFAQTTTHTAPPTRPDPGASQQQQRRGGERGMGKRHGRMGEGRENHEGMGALRLMRELDLTDAQKQQARAIMERYAASTKTQREELRGLREQKEQGTLTADAKAKAKSARMQLAESNKNMHNELLAILTPDQRAKFEKLEKEHKNERRENMRERRGGEGDEAPNSVQ